MNTPPSIVTAASRRLHLQPNHPILLTRQLIESRFPGFRHYNELFPVVSTAQNFDLLNFPPDHPGRSRTDTYYINKSTVFRTHTSAHQAEIFRANQSSGFLISADVYRRDAVDRSHYPVFHQMEGAMTWERRSSTEGASFADQIWADISKIPSHDVNVEDPNPTIHPERNPLQASFHSAEEAEAIATHLKRSLEDVVVTIFNAARATQTTASSSNHEPLRVRWVEAYFPFTSPSWELEVFWSGDWLEVLGCGIVKQSILNEAGVPSRSGWAFGLGLERIAMLLYSIPDIRLFWSQDPRFLSQFSSSKPPVPFAPFSKYPACPKDVAFWIRSSSAAGGQLHSAQAFHENDVMEIVRDVAGDTVEDVRMIDEFTHPTTGRKSMCYRINYRSLERTLTHEEANTLHAQICQRLVDKLGVELR
jgi:phenylalanyl-tRNA synthetase alpha chain